MIPRLDIKGDKLIKGVNLEGLRIIGDPNEFALKYYRDGADELIYIDAVASLYGRNNLLDIVEKAAQDVFIPITVGGGIKKIEDAINLLKAGADKIAVNTGAILRPELISELANHLGSQSVVVSIQAIKDNRNNWMAFTDNGREPTGMDVVLWAQRASELGAGEILITSVDQEGTEKGFDTKLISQITTGLEIPVIASGGFGNVQDLIDVVKISNADAIAVSSAFHYGRAKIKDVKELASSSNISMRVNIES